MRLFPLLSHRRPHAGLLAVLLAVAALAAAHAETLPTPTEPLKDYQGAAVVVLDLPPSPDGKGTGVNTWIQVEQSYVWPDRFLLDRSGEVSLVQSNIEMTYSPAVGYIVERVYKNMDQAEQNPIMAYQISMASYAKLLAELKNVRLLPAEDLDKLAVAEKEQIAALDAERQKVKEQQQVAALARYNSISAQMLRLRNDLDQIPFRRTHPCSIVEVDNADLMQTLLSKGLLGGTSAPLLKKGKTLFKVTRAEGLPIRIDTADNDGHVVLSFTFTDVRINSGLRNADLVLHAPRNTRTLHAEADVKEHNWEVKMEKELQKQIDLLEKERHPSPPARPVRRKPE